MPSKGKGRKRAREPVYGNWGLPHNLGLVPTRQPNEETPAVVQVAHDHPASAQVEFIQLSPLTSEQAIQTNATPSGESTLATPQLDEDGDSSDLSSRSATPTSVVWDASNAVAAALAKSNATPGNVKTPPAEDPDAPVPVAQASLRRKLPGRRSKKTASVAAALAVGSTATASDFDGAQTLNAASESEKPTKFRKNRASKKTPDKSDDEKPVEVKKKRVPKKTLDNPYGLTPGISPYPDLLHPTAEECEEVNRLLSSIHGVVTPPEKIPAPSLDVTGCGEVPSVLDAIIRTLLSGATTMSNSNMAFQGLVTKYGILEDGIGKGSVNWNNVRQSPLEEVIEAIKRGGLATNKGNNIKKILDMVYEDNHARCAAYMRELETGEGASVIGAGDKTQGQKNHEIALAEREILSLDHIHGMTPDQAMTEFTKLPGIGVKTASCVILFCLQQPSFAVDTHVFRITKWLSWVPEKATRDTAFSHLEVHVPAHLKYPLHQLFIRHGKTCQRCSGRTVEGTKDWEASTCVLEHLLKRTGKRVAVPPRKKKAKNGVGEDDSYSEEGGGNVEDEKVDKDAVNFSINETSISDAGPGRRDADIKIEEAAVLQVADKVQTRKRITISLKHGLMKDPVKVPLTPAIKIKILKPAIGWKKAAARQPGKKAVATTPPSKAKKEVEAEGVADSDTEQDTLESSGAPAITKSGRKRVALRLREPPLPEEGLNEEDAGSIAEQQDDEEWATSKKAAAKRTGTVPANKRARQDEIEEPGLKRSIRVKKARVE